jgi:hypothetical protein
MRWDENIKVGVKEMSCEGGRWNWLRIVSSDGFLILAVWGLWVLLSRVWIVIYRYLYICFKPTIVSCIENSRLRRFIPADRLIYDHELWEVTRDWKILYNKELHNLYSKPNIWIRWAGHVARIVIWWEFLQIFGWKSWRKEANRKT